MSGRSCARGARGPAGERQQNVAGAL